MDDLELFLLFTFGGIASWMLPRWWLMTIRVKQLTPILPQNRLLQIAPLLMVVILLLVLTNLSSFDVKSSVLYTAFYLLMGVAWITIALLFIPFVGLSARDDALERRNIASAYAIVGAFLGLTFCFAGGNIGNGPGWWVVAFSALLSTLGSYAIWIAFQTISDIATVVMVDRDQSAGVRLGGFLSAVGLILGRAVAGDWFGYRQAVADVLRFGWPVLLILVIGSLIERAFRPTVQHPTRPVVVYGFVPALLYISAACGALLAYPLSLSLAH